MSDNLNSTRDFLGFSLAGIFQHASAAGSGAEATTQDNDQSTINISSDQSGSVRSIEEDIDGRQLNFNDDDDDRVDINTAQKRKRNSYHRHTPEQIRELELLFKESIHPDEEQRHNLSCRLGLSSKQVKFWFQNRRTQLKTLQERQENSFLKAELDKLKDDNKILREAISKSCCLNCAFDKTGKAVSEVENNLYIENTRLKAEVEKLRAEVAGKYPVGNEPENRGNWLSFHTGTFYGLDKSRIFEIATQAMEELVKMATKGEPLWVRSVETGREILNYDEYAKEFLLVNSSNRIIRPNSSIEASRDSGFVLGDLHRLLQSFMDVKEWKEMFPSIITKAATIDVISNGEGPYRMNGAVQLMFAELQMMTPVVQARGVYFVRYCKQLSAEKWGVVDVSIDQVDDKIDETSSYMKCRKRASGFVVEDKGNRHCKVTWVEHVECQKSIVPTLFRTIVNSGMAFGAKRWISTLQQHCEFYMFYMATNVPTINVATLEGIKSAGRKGIIKMSQRMLSSFCSAIGSSSENTWTKVSSKNGDDMRVCSRKNSNDVIVCAVLSVWLPVSPRVVFDFLRDEAHRHKWDVRTNGDPAQLMGNLAKGQERGNAVAIQMMKGKDNSNMWVLQDSCTNNSESMVVYTPIEVSVLQEAMANCDSSSNGILASGFIILPDGIGSRPVIRSRLGEEDQSGSEGGSVLTIAIQLVMNNSPMESIEFVNHVISSTLQNIKTALHCEDC